MKLPLFDHLRIRLVLLVALALLPSMLMVAWVGMEEYRTAEARVGEEAMRLVHLAVAQQAQMLRDAGLLLEFLAHSREARSGDIATLAQDMARHADRLHTYNLGIITPDGRLLGGMLPLGARIKVSDLVCFRKILGSKDGCVSSVTTRISDKPAIVLFYPVLDDAGGVRLVMFAAIHFAWLDEFALGAQLPQGATLTVWDNRSTVLARQPAATKWVGKDFAAIHRFTSLIGQGKGLRKMTGLDGTRRIYAFARLARTREGSLFLSIGIPSQIPRAELGRLFSYICLLTSLAGVAFIAAWMFGEVFILDPLDRLLGCAKRISSGDLGARVGMPRPSGELGELAGAFDHMGEALEERQKERLQTEEALRQSENLYRTVFETTGTAMLLVEEDTTISLVNKQFEKLLGYCAEEVEGKSWADFPHTGDVSILLENHGLRRIAPDAAPKQYEARLLDRDGNIRDFLFTVDLIRGTGTSVASLMDITAWKKDRAVLEKTQEELRALSAKNLTLQEAEREKLAMELHDRVGQNLTGLSINLAIIRGLVGPECLKRMESRLLDAKGLVSDTMRCIRSVISELHPPGLSEYGLSAALAHYCEKLAARTEM
ncbi:MAG: PAS domain S-box protein, partial [Syntrophobacteraceae bacterium]